ncbi:MAG: amidohydrolase family protein [Bacillota bacterium]
MKAFSGMTLISCRGDERIRDAVALVRDGRIAGAGRREEMDIPADAKVVDLTGSTLLPGLIDSHVHCVLDATGDPMGNAAGESPATSALKAAGHLRATLEAGVTYIRDLGGRDYVDVDLRDAVRAGLIPGPSMQVAGRIITMTGGHGHPIGREADGVGDVARAAREQLKAGVDVVKVIATGGVMTPGVEPGCAQMSEEEMAVAVREAHNAGRKVATHAQGTSGIKNAIRAGVDSVEHGIFLDEEAVQMMKEAGVYLVPTLVAPHWIVEAGVEGGIPEYAVRKAQSVMESHLASFRMAREAGVRIAMGTDAGTPFNRHGQNAYELKLMVEAGMSPMDAILSATRVAAELLGVQDEVGTIEEGKRADMIVVSGDPLADIDEMLDVREVYVAGERVV